MITLDNLLGMLKKVRRSGHDWTACCPAHNDKTPSLSVGQGREGVVLKCHAGCDTSAILEALGLEWKDLFPERQPPAPLYNRKGAKAQRPLFFTTKARKRQKQAKNAAF